MGTRWEYVRDTIQEMYINTVTINNDITKIKELKALKAVGTTINMGGNLQIADTAVVFNNLVGNIPTKGLIDIEGEQLQYTGITWTGAGAGSLTGLKHGMNGTTKAIHTNGTLIQFGPIRATLATTINNNIIGSIYFTGLTAPIPSSGVISMRNDGGNVIEDIAYHHVHYTNAEKTAGHLAYNQRGYNNTTAAAHTAAATMSLVWEMKVLHREGVRVYNNIGSGDVIYVGFQPSIDDGTGFNGIPVEYLESITLPVDETVRIFAMTEHAVASGAITVVEYK
jgi:hypothetical protein